MQNRSPSPQCYWNGGLGILHYIAAELLGKAPLASLAFLISLGIFSFLPLLLKQRLGWTPGCKLLMQTSQGPLLSVPVGACTDPTSSGPGIWVEVLENLH